MPKGLQEVEVISIWAGMSEMLGRRLQAGACRQLLGELCAEDALKDQLPHDVLGAQPFAIVSGAACTLQHGAAYPLLEFVSSSVSCAAWHTC